MKKKNWQVKLGISLMIFSGVFFGLSIWIPFLELETKQKVFWSTACLITMEVVFWLGGSIVGKELFIRYKAKLNPKNWFRKKTMTDKEPL